MEKKMIDGELVIGHVSRVKCIMCVRLSSKWIVFHPFSTLFPYNTAYANICILYNVYIFFIYVKLM